MLFKLKLSQPSEKTMMYWIKTNEVVKLEYALKHGDYKTRQLEVEGLEHVGKPLSIPVLLHSMNNKIQYVSIAALNALETLCCNDKLVISLTSKPLTG
tara:strand:+ start:32716 stop:33009 length:294 start_codon:yes stop_codon:yes gene_type:complete